MRESFTFVGPGRTPEVEANAAFSMAHARKEQKDFQEIELKKTAEELEMIDFIDDILKSDFCSLGVAEMPEIRANRFHVIPESWFNQNQTESVTGAYQSFDGSVAFCRERVKNQLTLFRIMLHESVHMASHHKHYVDVKHKSIQDYRVGYRINNTSPYADTQSEQPKVPPEGSGEEKLENKNHSHLRAFNEGVVETTVEQLFYQYRDKILKKLSVSPDDLKNIRFVYPLFRAVVRAICEGIASHDGIHELEVWKKIKRGQYTGEMMHLRNIERTFGFEALDVLESLEIDRPDDVGSNNETRVMKKNKKILEYFQNYDRPDDNRSAVRRQLMDDILGKREETSSQTK